MVTIQEKIREIALAPITEHDFDGNVDEFFYELCVKAFNLGIETAADNSYIIYREDEVEVDKESILKLKIENGNI